MPDFDSRIIESRHDVLFSLPHGLTKRVLREKVRQILLGLVMARHVRWQKSGIHGRSTRLAPMWLGGIPMISRQGVCTQFCRIVESREGCVQARYRVVESGL